MFSQAESTLLRRVTRLWILTAVASFHHMILPSLPARRTFSAGCGINALCLGDASDTPAPGGRRAHLPSWAADPPSDR